MSRIFMAAAKFQASQSTCRRRKVGAVIVNPEGKIMGRGWNTEIGLEPGQSCKGGDCPRGTQDYEAVPAGSSYNNCVAIHAEIRAMNDIPPDVSIKGWTIYCTHEPCRDCAAALRQEGVVVVWDTALR